MPLTADRAKPAVPFGGTYRLVDFALSNLVNAEYRKIVVLTQYKSHSLDRHITQTWRMSTMLGNYVAPVPAQQRRRQALVPGQRRRDLPEPQPRLRREARHRRRGRRGPRLPDGLLPDGGTPRRSGGAVQRRRDPAGPVDARRPVRRDRGRPGRPAPDRRRSWRSPPTRRGLPDSPDEVLASMGNYVFDADALIDAVTRDSARRRHRATTWAGTSCPDFVYPRRGCRLRLHRERRARVHRPGPRLLARRRDARRLLRRAHGPHLGPPGLQPLQRRSGRSTRRTRRCRRPSSCTAGRAGSDTR